jgi:hypothetical protein
MHANRSALAMLDKRNHGRQLRHNVTGFVSWARAAWMKAKAGRP